MEQRYTYKFERVPTSHGFFGGRTEEYQEVIVQHATEGWRFVQAYFPSLGVYGSSTFVDLIFEKPC